jgi:hypothetical protein
MEQENLKNLELTLSKLKEKMLEDSAMREMFSTNFPDLDYEEHVENTIAQMYSYAVEKDYDIVELSLQGVRVFFESVFTNDDEDEEDEEIHGEA